MLKKINPCHLLFALMATLGILMAFPDVAMAAAADLPKDPTKAYITLAILVIAAALFATEAIPLMVTAMLVPCALSITGILTSKVAFSFFGDNTVVLFIAMFIIGEGIFVCGFAEKVGRLAVKYSKGKMSLMMLYFMLFVGILSGMLSNTGTTAVAVPLVLGLCALAKVAPGKLLMPVAFAASLGGTLTLVGTPPNGIVNSVLQQNGLTPLGFFEFAKFGLPLFIVGIVYYVAFGYRLLPDVKANEHKAEEEKREYRLDKMPITVAIFGFVIVMMVSGWMPLTTAAMTGVCLMLIFKSITVKEAYKCVDWDTIFLFAGMLSMSAAMQKSGAATIVANAVVSSVSSPMTLLFVVCFLTALLTNFMSNTATAALMAPLALPIAADMGVSPIPLMVGICMSASACFLTPIATPPNTLVLGPGNYKFIDYFKAGWPLQIIALLMCTFGIPLIWPF